MLTQARLEEVLKAMGLKDAGIDVSGGPSHFSARIVSSEFDGQDEAVRQRRVWGYLYEALTEAESAQVDFVYTVTAAEDERRFVDLAGGRV